MKIKSQLLIEYLGVDDTDELNFNSLKMAITSEILDDPEALAELGQIYKQVASIDTIIIKITKEDPDLSEKLASVMPPKVKKMLMFGKCHNQDLDFSNYAEFDSLEEISIIKDDDMTNDDQSPVECSLGDVKLPRRLNRLFINSIDGLGSISIPPEIRKTLTVSLAGTAMDVEGMCIPDVRTAEITLCSTEQLGKLREVFPDIQAVKEGDLEDSSLVSIDEAELLIERLNTINTVGTFSGTRKDIEKLILFANGNNDYSIRLNNYLIRDNEIIDTSHFPSMKVGEFDFDSLGDAKFATVVFKDASELSTDKAQEMLEEARKRGVKLAVRFEDENIGKEAKTPQTMETYVECSKVMDQIINEVLNSVPENASETVKYAKLYEIFSSRYYYDYNALPEVNAIQAVLKSDSSRNITGLLAGECVCAGYAEIMRNLARRLGIECEVDQGRVYSLKDTPQPSDTIAGTLKDGRQVVVGLHAWNRVKLDGTWYMSDPTWDHSRINQGKVPIYMAFTEEQGRKEGRISSHAEEGRAPECTTKMPREKLAALYPHLDPTDIYTQSDVELYGMDPAFLSFSKAAPGEEDYKAPDSEIIRKYKKALDTEPTYKKVSRVLINGFRRARVAFKSMYHKLKSIVRSTKDRLINGKQENLMLDKGESDEKIPSTLDRYNVSDRITGKVQETSNNNKKELTKTAEEIVL